MSVSPRPPMTGNPVLIQRRTVFLCTFRVRATSVTL